MIDWVAHTTRYYEKLLLQTEEWDGERWVLTYLKPGWKYVKPATPPAPQLVWERRRCR